MNLYKCLLVLLILTATNSKAQQRNTPNIVIILADDLGYGDIEGYGASYRTPNLKKLQKEGMKFTSFYAQPQCSPSRAALMTGCYPQRVGIPGVLGPKGADWTKDIFFIGLNPEEQTLPELLKEKGYTTACIGKWHLGHYVEHLPTRHGFDQYFGLPYSHDISPETSKEWPDLPLIEGEKVIELNPDLTQLTKRYTEKSVEFIHQNKTKPFFLYLAHSMPHVPIFASAAFKGKSGKGLYADVITEIDWSVGEIMKALKKNGVEKNTILIFTSDNGPWLQQGNHGGSAGKFRDGKGTIFEGGVQVPMIARWPGKIPAGTTCTQIAALFDLLPTFTQIPNTGLPKLPIDGKSILPLLLNTGQQSIREIHYYFNVNELQAVRKGKWKLHLPHGYVYVTKPGVDETEVEITTLQIGLSLFDLEADPGEQTNVAQQYPELVKELQSLAIEFDKQMNLHKRMPGKSKSE